MVCKCLFSRKEQFTDLTQKLPEVHLKVSGLNVSMIELKPGIAEIFNIIPAGVYRCVAARRKNKPVPERFHPPEKVLYIIKNLLSGFKVSCLHSTYATRDNEIIVCQFHPFIKIDVTQRGKSKSFQPVDI